MPKIPDLTEPPISNLSPRKKARGERLAVNLWDVSRLDGLTKSLLLGGKLKTRKEDLIWVDRSLVDETAVEFSCDLLTAAATCDTLRSHDRQVGDGPTRVYLRREKVWVRLPGAAVLTRVVDGALILDPALFPPTLDEVQPLPVEVFPFKRS